MNDETDIVAVNISECERLIAMLYQACLTTEGAQTALTDEQFNRLVAFLRSVIG